MSLLISFSHNLQDVTLLSIFVRLGLAILLGGIIGMQRGANKHAAGFRTHILVCLGAALAMLTNQYVMDYITPNTDPTRLGAQVISGIGFLGVGTIIMSGKTKIRGLTTAAGLWASACVGLALGIGFYIGALSAALLIYISLAFLTKFEVIFYGRSRITEIYLELTSRIHLQDVTNSITDMNIEILDISINRVSPELGSATAVLLNIELPNNLTKVELMASLCAHNHVLVAEEL